MQGTLRCCSRASFLVGASALGTIGATGVIGWDAARAAGYAGANVAPDDALSRLMQGNAAYVHEMAGSRLNTIEERAALGKGQAPWASILTCADSRTAPEILFNQGLGDIFVDRVAGNVATSLETASLEFGSAVLGSQLIMVMGHSGCGAVRSAIAYSKGETMPSEDLTNLVQTLQPAVERSKTMKGDQLANATKANAVIVAANLRGNAIFKGLMEKKKLKIVASYCDLSTGKVTLL
ncbi:MAG TPA: carbonic anhydrase [Candidatus Binatia bacterium]|nr:carbonic anhydrase [Candidatus Binatia bacterium]